MQLAALIIACLSLIMSIGSLVWQLAKHWSTHTVQMVSAESLLTPKSAPILDEYREFDQVIDDKLSAEEKEYFEKHARRQ